MTPEQLMEIPGIGEKMVDKIYQAVNRFYEGGEAAAAVGEAAETAEPVEGDATEESTEAGTATTEEVAAPEAETAAEESTQAASEETEPESESKSHAAAADATEHAPEDQQEEKNS